VTNEQEMGNNCTEVGNICRQKEQVINWSA